MKHTEHQEQVAFFKIAALYAVTDPRWSCIYAVPNAAKRSPRQGKWMKDEGMKAGVPDICVTVAASGYHGLYIEMKTKTGRLTDSQKMWIDRLKKQGYLALVARGCDDALDIVRRYFDDKGND